MSAIGHLDYRKSDLGPKSRGTSPRCDSLAPRVHKFCCLSCSPVSAIYICTSILIFRQFFLSRRFFFCWRLFLCHDFFPRAFFFPRASRFVTVGSEVTRELSLSSKQLMANVCLQFKLLFMEKWWYLPFKGMWKHTILCAITFYQWEDFHGNKNKENIAWMSRVDLFSNARLPIRHSKQDTLINYFTR